MTIKPDKWIRRMAQEYGMTEPFAERQARDVDDSRMISYGVSSYGYGMRYVVEFKVFTNIHLVVVDPKNFDEKNFVDINSDVCITSPNSFTLAHTVEYFRISHDVLTICSDKSIYARYDIIVNVTLLEPEQKGHVTLEFSSTTSLPAKIYANEGVVQVLFLQSDGAYKVSYKDRGSKYQGRRGMTLSEA